MEEKQAEEEGLLFKYITGCTQTECNLPNSYVAHTKHIINTQVSSCTTSLPTTELYAGTRQQPDTNSTTGCITMEVSGRLYIYLLW